MTRELAPAPRRREGRPLATASDRYWVKDLKPGTELDELFVVRSKDVRQRRGGGPYLALTLGDRTGEVTGLVWENVERLGKLCEVGQVLRIRGQVQRYNQRLQVVVRGAEPVPAGEVDEALFVRSSEIDPDILWQRLIALVEEVGDPHLKQLLFRVFSDAEVAQRLQGRPRGPRHAPRLSVRAARAHGLDGDLGAGARPPLPAARGHGGRRGAASRPRQGLGARDRRVDRVHRRRPPARTPGDGGAVRRAHHRRAELVSRRSTAGTCCTSCCRTTGSTSSARRAAPRRRRRCWSTWPTTSTRRWRACSRRSGAGGDDEDAWSEFSRILDRHVYRRRLPAADNGATSS